MFNFIEITVYNKFFCRTFAPMFKRLQQKWKVNGWQLFLILCVFAITGSTTAWISKSITSWVGLTPQSPLLYRAGLRTLVLLFGYQVIILVVSIPFGQFNFFWNYEKKILRWLGKLTGIIKKDNPSNS
ncbi:MAG: diacylglyceryl transferase [Sphingobacteriales bacterium]|nr:MAG: diacylglyceryl transferase [Sphingobacteriales bacterium]